MYILLSILSYLKQDDNNIYLNCIYSKLNSKVIIFKWILKLNRNKFKFNLGNHLKYLIVSHLSILLKYVIVLNNFSTFFFTYIYIYIS